MTRLILSVLCVLTFAVPAWAQQQVTTTTTPTTAPPQAAPQMPTTRTPITPQIAQSYYQNCLAAPSNPPLSPSTRDIFCQCTSTYIQRNISYEEMAMANQATPAGNAIRQKILLQVYAPCMEFPVRELIHGECSAKPQLAAQPHICPCVSKHVAQYMAQSAQQNLAGLMKAGQDLADPMNALMESAAFQQAQQSIAMKCMTGAIN